MQPFLDELRESVLAPPLLCLPPSTTSISVTRHRLADMLDEGFDLG